MNTVDALNVLGKALCGDSFEVKPGLTDAETILEIAKNYEGGGGSDGSEPQIPIINIVGDDVSCTTVQTYKEIVDLIDAGNLTFYVKYTDAVEGYNTYQLYDFDKVDDTDGTIYLISTSVTFNSSANNCLCKARGVVFEKTTVDEPAIASYTTYDVVV